MGSASSSARRSPAGVKTPLSVQLAKASWIAPLLVVVMNFLLKNVSTSKDESLVQSVVFTVVASLFFVTGFGSGVVALFGIRRHGWRGILIPALIGVLISGAMIGVVTTNVLGARHRIDPQAEVEAAVAKINAGLPQMVDEHTEFTAASTEPGKVVFRYSFPGVASADIDIPAFRAAIEPELANRYCQDMAIYWKNGFALAITYSSSDGVEIANIVLTPDRCDVTP